jgi:hypothetical protein
MIGSEYNKWSLLNIIVHTESFTKGESAVGRNFTFVKEKKEYFEWLVWRIPFSNMNLTKWWNRNAIFAIDE